MPVLLATVIVVAPEPQVAVVTTGLRIASDIAALGPTSGTLSPPCMMSLTNNSRRPSMPPG